MLQEQLGYWRKQLQDAPPLLELPLDRPRPARQEFRGALETVALAPTLASAIKAACRSEGVTLFMYLLAGFQALLSRYSGQEQIVVGTDLANRPTMECEQVIGFFINLLAIRTDLSGNPTYRELLGRVRETALGAYAHQDMPFDKLVEELQPERNPSYNAVVQVLFVMQNTPTARAQLAGLELSSLATPLTRSKFDIGVFVTDTDKGLTGHWVYNTDIFERATILRVAANFEMLLASAIGNPECRLSALEFLTTAEKQQRGAATADRKKSQHKKLMAVEPKAVRLAPDNRDGNL